MSKDWTEQWRKGTLPENWYYVHIKSEWGGIDCITINYCDEDGVFEEYPDEDIKEVICPVPDYMDCKRLMNDSIELDKAKIKIYELVSKTDKLEKQLEIATKALENAHKFPQTMSLKEYCEQALKEMEEV